MQIGHLLWPKIEDLVHPRGNVAHNAKVVNKSVEMLALCLKIGWVGQFAKVGIFGIFEKRLCEVFNWWICEIGLRG